MSSCRPQHVCSRVYLVYDALCCGGLHADGDKCGDGGGTSIGILGLTERWTQKACRDVVPAQRRHLRAYGRGSDIIYVSFLIVVRKRTSFEALFRPL